MSGNSTTTTKHPENQRSSFRGRAEKAPTVAASLAILADTASRLTEVSTRPSDGGTS